MRILYYSVHEILEYDDMSMFTRMGHKVFSLGAYMQPSQSRTFRPERLEFFDTEMLAEYRRLGLCAEFAERFDVLVFNHEVDVLYRDLSSFGNLPIVYRTIGQSSDHQERVASLLGDRIQIARYSPLDRITEGAKTDCVISFAKNLSDYDDWHGGARGITFLNDYPARSSDIIPSADVYKEIVGDAEVLLYGRNNEGFRNNRGLADFRDMRGLYANCAFYLYSWSKNAPYTLGLMEALITGAPVIAPSLAFVEEELNSQHDKETADRLASRYEVEAILQDPACLTFSTVAEARSMSASAMSADSSIVDMARRVRDRARCRFDERVVGALWNEQFRRMGLM